ncbi:hypothetical protein [Nitrobacter sp.]|uniref:hypothetical protein n=1 Tax=Nitrobacter sp. TaxID=29420 RepID=UPI0029CABC67|nr:hypothetical protein [Nitrobacter sp.]
MPKKQKADETTFTQRVLMSLAVDVTCLAENVERVKTQVFAMAMENGVAIPKPEQD